MAEAEIRESNQYALDQSELLQAQSVNPIHYPSIGVGHNSKRKQLLADPASTNYSGRR
ncbi:hypothetical protein JHK82_026087 [Glycine max]|nr:hypothetical protein JHK87_026025 [Glycine soja]KAG5134899.1 hypothetical protein JHK82_026087 [Glycine max]